MLEEQFGIEQPLDMEAVSEEWAPYESKTVSMHMIAGISSMESSNV
jgi:hypothetical protein